MLCYVMLCYLKFLLDISYIKIFSHSIDILSYLILYYLYYLILSYVTAPRVVFDGLSSMRYGGGVSGEQVEHSTCSS